MGIGGGWVMGVEMFDVGEMVKVNGGFGWMKGRPVADL